MTIARPSILACGRKTLLAYAALSLTTGSVLTTASDATTHQAAVGIVEGSASLVHVDDTGKRTVIRGRSLKNVVVFLHPKGHSPSFSVPEDRAVIRQRKARFDPAFTVITQGQVIDFPNDDRILHNVFSYSPARAFDLGIYKQGESRAIRFDRPGPVELFCSIHSSMYALIYVTPNPFFSVTDKKGEFRISNVPVGKYELRTWHKRLPQGVESVEVKEVDVQAESPVTVNVELGGL